MNKIEEKNLIVYAVVICTKAQALKLNQLVTAIKGVEKRVVSIAFVSPEEGEDEVKGTMRIRFKGTEKVDEKAIWSVVEKFVPVPDIVDVAKIDLKLLKTILFQGSDAKIEAYVNDKVIDIKGTRILFVQILKVIKNLIIILRIKLDE